MRLSPDSRPDPSSTSSGEHRLTFAPIAAAMALSLLGFLAVGLVGARPVTAADATMSPFVTGRHVYDYGNLLSSNSVNTAEALATRIEAAGGGRVVIYTAVNSSDLPDKATLAEDWHVDGILLDGSGTDYGNVALGATLKGKLSKDQAGAVDSSLGFQTVESWMLTSLARADAFLSGAQVFDGTGLLDANGKQKAEAAAKELQRKIGAPVYIDISLGGENPSSDAFFAAADLSSAFRDNFVIALAVSGTQIGGSIETDNSNLWDQYHAVAPWKTTTLSTHLSAGSDVQAALLADINAVQGGSSSGSGSSGSGSGGISGELIFWVIFTIVIVVLSIGAPFFFGPWLIRKLTGATAPIKGGLPGSAVIETITDTGVTVTMASVGPDAPEYKFGLQVTPSYGSSQPYHVEAKALVPRIYIPMVVPGAQVGVLIDPTDPMKVSVDFSRMSGAAAARTVTMSFDGVQGGGYSTAAAGAVPGASPMLSFDASGMPAAGGVESLVGAIRSGAVPTIKGSYETLMATGTRGAAVITTAMPFGKTAGQVNPSVNPERFNYPVWVFTVEVSLAGEDPFPAVFGHFVRPDKVGLLAPGVKLAVSVDPQQKYQDVAIDWDKSPLA